MSGHDTQVFRVDGGRVRALEDALSRAQYEFRKPPSHARFQARGEGTTVTLYTSGKLVVQGTGLGLWSDRFLGGAMPEPKKKKSKTADAGSSSAELDQAALPVELIGSDEAGKGDTFGSMVVAATAVDARGLLLLQKMGVRDSKSLNDDRIRLIAPQIREQFAHRERSLLPAAYNEAHAEHGSNVNRLLTTLHADLVAELHEETGWPVAVVDRFGNDRPVTRALATRAPDLRVLEVPRAEEVTAVAAASILARDRFLSDLKELGEEWAVDLPLGSGTPAEKALRRFLQIHDGASLQFVAKTHFRNVRLHLDKD